MVGFRFIVSMWRRGQPETERRLRSRMAAEHREAQQRREEVLEAASVSRGGMTFVEELVRASIDADPEAARRYDLESLLDRYTDLVIANHRCTAELGRADISDLRGRLDIAIRLGQERQRTVLVGRLELCKQLQELSSTLHEEIEAIVELLQLYLARVTMPDDVAQLADGSIDQRIQIFDDDE